MNCRSAPTVSPAAPATGRKTCTMVCTIANHGTGLAAWVAGKVEISRRRENLSWSHHRAGAGKRLNCRGAATISRRRENLTATVPKARRPPLSAPAVQYPTTARYPPMSYACGSSAFCLGTRNAAPSGTRGPSDSPATGYFLLSAVKAGRGYRLCRSCRRGPVSRLRGCGEQAPELFFCFCP